MTKEKTMDIVSDCFYELAQKHSIEKITVHMICESSGVSRSTFYRFFKDKNDVMNYYFRKYCEELIKEYASPRDCKAFLHAYAKLIQRYSKYFYSALSVEGQNSFKSYLYDYGYRYYRIMVEAGSGEEVSQDLDIMIKIFTAGTVSITRQWIKEKINVSPEHLADVVFESMPAGMARYLG